MTGLAPSAPDDRPLTLACLVAVCIVTLGGCASVRTEMLSVAANDGSWTLSAMLATGRERCGIGRPVLTNHGSLPIGGNYLVIVADASQTRRIGELIAKCPVVLPRESAHCSLVGRPLLFSCEPVFLLAGPVVTPPQLSK